jgi:hypothetical protein
MRKTLGIPLRTIFRREKTSEFFSESLSEEKNFGFCSESFSEEKNLGKR